MNMAIGIGIATGWQKPSGGPTCGNFRYATVGTYMDAINPYTFTGWTINGLDLYTNYVYVINGSGCYTNYLVTNYSLPFESKEFIIYYYGTSDPVFTILDSLGNAIPLTWKTICDKTCYQADIPSSSSVISAIPLCGVDFLAPIYTIWTWGGTIDLSSPSSVSAAEAYYKQLAGASTTITSVYEPLSDTYTVQIKNAYLSSAPNWDSNYFYQISC